MLRDTMLIYRRYLRQTLRNKVAIVFGALQPLLYLVFFGPLLTRVADAPGFGGDAWQVYVPGLLIQLGLFSAGFAGFGLIADLRSGVLERFRVTPVGRVALLLGRVLRDTTVMLVQAAMLLMVGVAFGLRAPLPGVLTGLLFVVLLSVSVASLSYALALSTRDEDAFAPLLTSAIVPLMLLSGMILPMSMAPRWLDVLSHANPFRYFVDAVRALFLGHYTATTVWEGMLVAVLMVAGCVTFGARRFAAENA